MSAVIDSTNSGHGHADHAHGPAKGLMRWVLTTNHKDIGSMYLWFSFAMFLLGGSMAMVIRAELFQPGLQIVQPEFFNQMTTMHGLIMVFGAVMPAFVGLANWMVPLMIGAPDMALPRMNNFSFWLLPAALKKLVPKWMSINIMVTQPASTGITAISRKAVISQVQTNSGIFIRVMPGARRLRMVAMMLIAPMIELIPIRCTAKIKKVTLSGA